jgi:hypothetical protein
LRAAALAAVTVAMALCAAPPAAARWSSPGSLSGCDLAFSSLQAPLIVFPSAEPQSRSGPGALLWSAPRECASGAAGTEAFGATLSTDDLPGGGSLLADGASGLTGILAATGTAAGQVVVAGSGVGGETLAGSGVDGGTMARGGADADTTARSATGVGTQAGSGMGGGTMAEGRTPGTFTSRPLGGPATPVAASSSYLGDTVLASPVRTPGAGWAIAVRVQRHYSSSFAPPRLLPVGPAPVRAVIATMDYRADILVAWVSAGGVYAREIPATGPIGLAQRLGSAGAEPEIGALISDDGHAIVAWRSQSTAQSGGDLTTIELSLCEVSSRAVSSSRSASGSHSASDSHSASGFPASSSHRASGSRLSLSARAALTVERFRDPPGFPPPAGSLRLIRLSSEAVTMGWTGMSTGRYVVRASPVSLRRGAWAPVTISGASRGQDAVLADLVAGPHAEALALWSTAPRTASGVPNPRRRAIHAAQGHYAEAGKVAFAAPETVAPPGSNGPPAAALDPRSGLALAAWVEGSRIAYALRAAGPASAVAPAGAGTAVAGHSAGDSARALLAALAILLLAAAAAFLVRAAGMPRHVRARRG